MKHNVMKRTLAGVMAVLCVAAYLPANVGTGGLFGGTEIVANATEYSGGYVSVKNLKSGDYLNAGTKIDGMTVSNPGTRAVITLDGEKVRVDGTTTLFYPYTVSNRVKVDSVTKKEGTVTSPTYYYITLTTEKFAATVTNGSTVSYYSTFSEARSNWTANSTLKLNDNVTIDSTITVSETKTLDLNGYGIKMTGNSSVLYIGSGGTLTLKDSNSNSGTHYYTKATSSGAGQLLDSYTEGAQSFTGGYLTGGKGYYLSSNNAHLGGCVYINGGTLNMEGGTMVANASIGSSYTDGGSVCVNSNGTFNMQGGAILAGYTASGAAGVMIGKHTDGNGTFNMSGGVIKHCYGKHGVVRTTWGSNSKFNMTGGLISENAGETWATVVLEGSEQHFTMSGGEISNNSLAGVLIQSENNNSFEISGSPRIFGNSINGSACNVWIPGSNSKITVTGSLTNTTPIGITMQAPGIFTSGNGAAYKSKFTSDDADYDIDTYNTELRLVEGPSITKSPSVKTGLVYNGQSQALVEAGATNDGNYLYQINKGAWSKDIPTAKNAGTYNVNWYIEGDSNHGNSAIDGYSVTIAKATPSYTVPSGLTATFGQKLSDVTLPDGWAWADSSQSVGDVGANTFKANYTPTDTANYNTVSGVDVTVAVGHVFTAVGKQEPTCTENGYEAYWTDEENNMYSDAEGKNSITAPAEIPATGHDWNAPAYEWNADNTQVTATRTCKHDADHVETETANVSVTTTDATIHAKGEKVYTATFTNTAFETQTKAEEIAQLTPEYAEAEYTWAEDNSSVTAIKKCTNGDADITETVDTVYSVTKNAACEATGTGLYTANFTNDAFAAQTMEIEIPATGHTAGEAVKENEVAPTYEEDGSYDEVVYCSVCGEEVSRETITIPKLEMAYTLVNAVSATCTEAGNSAYYTGSDGKYYVLNGEEYKEIEENSWVIPATGHKLTKTNAKAATINAEGNIAYWTCSECGKIFSDENGTTEITLEDTVIPKLTSYEIKTNINGDTATKRVQKKKSTTVTAPAVEGKKFSHWEVNGKKVSTSAKYSFIVLKNTEVTAVYVNAAEEIKAEPVLNISTSKTTSNGKNAINFLFTRSIPEGYTVQEAGILYATNKLAGAKTSVSDYATLDLTKSANAATLNVTDVEDVVKNNRTGKVKKCVYSNVKADGTISLTYVIGANTTAYVYAVGYVKATNAEGKSVTLYTDFAATNYTNS